MKKSYLEYVSETLSSETTSPWIIGKIQSSMIHSSMICKKKINYQIEEKIHNDFYFRPRHTTLPPFTATGILAGNQHFFTFDGKFLEFAGDCSYVLARDFQDGKFTVIANYR